YRISDPAMRFYFDIVAPLESALATQDPAAIWQEYVAPRFDAYMGRIFETIVEEAYYRLQAPLGLPLISEWGRWERLDRDRRPLEMDIASDRKSTRLNSSHGKISYAVFCLKK